MFFVCALNMLCFIFATVYFRGNVEKREALKNPDLIHLCLDEISDCELFWRPMQIVLLLKLQVNSIDSGAPLSEQMISQALATAREHLTRSLLK
ncbi:hypothetical protein ACS0TY_013238 [Phlomoides rotata]